MSRLRLLTLVRHQGALIALLVACLFGFARYATFLTGANLLNVLLRNSMVGLMALGMTFVILTAGIDLSVGALFAVASVAAAAASGSGTAAAVAAGVGAGALLGLVNGLAIAKGRIQPFVATLAMMLAARGVALAVTDERPISASPAAAGLAWLGRGTVGPLPVPVLLLALAFALGWLVLRYTTFGRHVYAVGDDQDAARLLGLRVDRVLIGTYALSGALAGLAGVVLAGRLSAGMPSEGVGWELDAIAAVVVGGTLLTGGRGGAGLTLVGVLLLGVILNLIRLEGTLSSWWEWVIRGAFLLAVVVLQARVQRRAEEAVA